MARFQFQRCVFYAGGCMQHGLRMAVMVTAQEEMIQRIDHDLDDTLDNTKKAQDMPFES